MRQSDGGEKWSVGRVLTSPNFTRIVFRSRFCGAQFERLERIAEHGGIPLSVVAKPSLPKREGAYRNDLGVFSLLRIPQQSLGADLIGFSLSKERGQA